MSAVSVVALERSYGYAPVLGALDLEVERSEHVTVEGPNGSGKTTLLRVLAGLLRASSGRVSVLGGVPSDPGVRRRIGFVPHVPPLYPRMTAGENLRFWSRLYSAPGAEQRGAQILERLGIDPSDRRTVGAYSQGMRQRVSIARALCTSPELVLADEPLAALDPATASIVAVMLGEGRTLIAATHDASQFSTSRRLALSGGRLVAR